MPLGKAVDESGVGIFACATFADDENGNVGGGNFTDNFVQSANGGARAVDKPRGDGLGEKLGMVYGRH